MMQAKINERGGETTAGRKKMRRPSSVTFNDELVFDDGTRVLINRLLDKGEFRRVYVARDVRDAKQLYALKRIDCQNVDEEEQCRKEAAVHRLLRHENIMPLLEMKVAPPTEEGYGSCFMLFPYLQRSLRDEIDSRRLLEDRPEKQRRPFTSQQALSVFSGIVRAVKAIHEAGFSHRDIRPENVLLQPKKGKRRGRDMGIPVLSDFGSVGPLTATLASDEDVVRAREEVERYTSIAFRAPELFELSESEQYTPSEHHELQYGPADVWSLGCLLFAMLYGLSPFEMKWRVSFVEGAEADGAVEYVGASYENVVDNPIPFPPDGSAADARYGEDAKGLVRWMLTEEATKRPTTRKLLEQVEDLLGQKNLH